MPPNPVQVLPATSHTTTTTTTTPTILVLSFLVFTVTCSTACDPCMPKTKPNQTKNNATSHISSGTVSPFCLRDTLEGGACVDILGGMVGLVVGLPPSGGKCCALLNCLANLEAATCLCTAIKANVLGMGLDVPVALGLLLSPCNKSVPLASNVGRKCVLMYVGGDVV